jgi:glyoxylase-like metal-dependent hydrolase (beta-lactamase superfamily II)
MTQFKYSKGLHDLGKGVYAYLQPDGSWGLSNAGLIVDGEKSLLVDTLFDLTLTQEMLNAMKEVTKAAESIDILVNTHSNGDHVFGNQLVSGAEIITSEACAQEMAATPPQMLALGNTSLRYLASTTLMILYRHPQPERLKSVWTSRLGTRRSI